MVIAVACDGLHVARATHYCSDYAFYTVEAGRIIDLRNIPAAYAHPQGELAALLIGLQVDCFITGDTGSRLATELQNSHIEVVEGVHGSARQAVEAYCHTKALSRS